MCKCFCTNMLLFHRKSEKFMTNCQSMKLSQDWYFLNVWLSCVNTLFHKKSVKFRTNCWDVDFPCTDLFWMHNFVARELWVCYFENDYGIMRIILPKIGKIYNKLKIWTFLAADTSKCVTYFTNRQLFCPKSAKFGTNCENMNFIYGWYCINDFLF